MQGYVVVLRRIRFSSVVKCFKKKSYLFIFLSVYSAMSLTEDGESTRLEIFEIIKDTRGSQLINNFLSSLY